MESPGNEFTTDDDISKGFDERVDEDEREGWRMRFDITTTEASNHNRLEPIRFTSRADTSCVTTQFERTRKPIVTIRPRRPLDKTFSWLTHTLCTMTR